MATNCSKISGNWFRLTPDGSLDRQYLRICAVYRCVSRWGMDMETAKRLLAEKRVGPAIVEIWFREKPWVRCRWDNFNKEERNQ